MSVRPTRCQVSLDGLVSGAHSSRSEEHSGMEVQGRITTPRVAFVSMWAFALASGLVALGLTDAIGVLVTQRSVRVPLQFATIPTVAIVAGLDCEGTLMRVRSVIGGRHQQH